MDSSTTAKDHKVSVDHDVQSSVLADEYDSFLQLNEQFTPERRKALLRKIDLRVLPALIVVYLFTYIDRSNAGNAKSFGALDDLGIDEQQWNAALSVFFITYALGGVPSNIALKRYGPRLWLPILLTGCGLLIVCAGLQSTYGGWIVFRLLLGLVEAGVFPGCSFILTSWYSPRELHTRMTIFYSAASLAGAFSSLLAYGIARLDYTWGYRGWRFIYVIEGLFSFLLGLSSVFFIPTNPERVTSWLSPEEKQFLIGRQQFARSDENERGEMVKEENGFSWDAARSAFRSFHTYAVAAIEFTVAVVVYGISFVLPTIVEDLGYSDLKAQAMTAPPYVFACIVTIISGVAADRYRTRMLSVAVPNIMAVVGFIIIIASVRYPYVSGVTYFGIFLMAGGLYPISPAVMAWTALNMAGSMKRAVGMALMMSISQLGGIVGSNIFISSQAPTYPVGFGICLGMLVVFGVIWPFIYYFILKRINARRASVPEQEVLARYTYQQLAAMGDESPLFRYAL